MVAPKQPKPGQKQASDVGGGERVPLPGKVTQVEQQYGTGNWEVELDTGQHMLCTPNLGMCINAPPRPRNTYLDPILSMSREEIEQKIQDRIAAGKQQVCGTLPLGGVFFGTLDAYQRAIGIDNFEIQMRTLKNMETSVAASITGAVMKMQGQDDARILNATEAMVLLTGMLGAAMRPAADRANRPTAKPTSRKAPTEQRPPAAKSPASEPEVEPTFSETAKLTLGAVTRPPRGRTTPIGPGVRIPKSQLQPRDKTLVDDLKLRSVPTLRNGDKNDDFDELTPSFIAGHFKSEQRRTGSDDPRDWRAPKGYQAQHPNGRPYKIYGEPAGTTLTWGTTSDNRDLQKPRELGQTPHAKPKPLPGE